MISYHSDTDHLGTEYYYAKNFRVAPTGDVHRIARGMLRFVWSPIIFQDGRRCQKNFLSASWCVLDFDSGEMTLRQAIDNVFCDAVHIIGTTKSHQKLKGGVVADRFRVLLAFDHPVTSADAYTWTMRRYIDLYGADPACKDAARFFWPCQTIESISHEGYGQEVFTPPARASSSTFYRDSDAVRRRTVEALKQEFPRGERNNYCFMVAKDLAEAGYNFDEIYEIILRSPTYLHIDVPMSLRLEITQCVRNGLKSIEEGIAYGRQQQQRRQRQCQGSDTGETQEGQEGKELGPHGAGIPDCSKDEPR